MTMPLQEFTDAERETLARFEAARPAPESYRPVTSPTGFLAALDQAHAAATPEGEWSSERMFWKLQSDLMPDGWWQHVTDANGTVALLSEVDDDIAGDATAEDRAALIVAAVNALPGLTAALRAVLGMHVPVTGASRPEARYCRECSYGMPWPCPTVSAVSAALGVDGGQTT